MLRIILLLSITFTSLTAYADFDESIIHDVVKDKFIKSGVVYIKTVEIKSDSFIMELNYKIVAQVFFIQKVLKGTKSVELPSRYLTPYGYEELEKLGSISDEQSTVTHLGRVNLPMHFDCHIIKIVPKDDNHWDGKFTYCSDIRSIGFARAEINMRSIPWIGSHTVYSELRD